jgi:hypothetical protein
MMAMDDLDFEPEPKRPVPGIVWLLAGVGLVALFAALVVLLGGHMFAPHAVGPPAGAP